MFYLFLVWIFVFMWLLGFGAFEVSFVVLGNLGFDELISFIFDDVSLMCVAMLIFCGFPSLVYCFHYLGSGVISATLYGLMLCFLCVMSVLVFTSSTLSTLIFWEYLGFVSFFLILFYRNNSSLRSSLVTLFASRFGDVGLFFVVAWIGGFSGDLCFWSFFLCLLLVVLTKSACYPFISWLLEAMRAPTPVSSLVHSSTLVAAGTWFVVRYSSFFEGLLDWLFFFSILTIIVSGCCSLVFSDLKKLVALSTCNNISWCLIFFIFENPYLTLLQLLTHGVCKCYLFMSVGDLMGSSGGSQESVSVYVSRYCGWWSLVVRSVLVVSLCGVPYLGLFYCKHLLFSGVFYSFDVASLVLLIFGLVLSYAYSFRLAVLLISSSLGLSLGYVSVFRILSCVSYLGSFLGYLGSYVFSEVVSSTVAGSVSLLLFQLVGIVIGCWFSLGGFSSVWLSALCGADVIVNFMYNCVGEFLNVLILSVYRWEFGLLGWWSVNFKSYYVGGFALNIVILGVLYFLFVVGFSS